MKKSDRIKNIVKLFKLAQISTIIVDRKSFLEALTGFKKREVAKIPQITV